MKVFLAIFVAVLACIAIPVAQSQEFIFYCPGSGNYAVEDDCQSFYLCTAKNSPGVMSRCLLPSHRYFDAAAGKCVNGTGCISTTTTTTTTTEDISFPADSSNPAANKASTTELPETSMPTAPENSSSATKTTTPLLRMKKQNVFDPFLARFRYPL